MLLVITKTSVAAAEIPQYWRGFLERTERGYRLTGDPTGDREIFVYAGSDEVCVASDLGELLQHLRTAGLPVDLDPFGISSALHHGLVPVPATEYRDIYFMSMGDVGEINVGSAGVSIELDHRYPWRAMRSAGTERPDTRRLLDLLAAATERRAREANNQGFLMLSSGKDSSSIALALAEAGIKGVSCVTYSSGPDDPEPPVAAGICRRLGLDHRIVEMPTDPAITARLMRSFFAASPRPGVDLSQIPYTLTTGLMRAKGAIFDGGGNDSYMGFLPGPHDRLKMRFRIRNRWLAAAVENRIPHDSQLNYLTRSRAATALPGRAFRFAETQHFYGDAVDTRGWWYGESRKTRDHDLIDLLGAIKERHGDSAGSMQKLRLSAHAVAMTAAMPFCDRDVADYYFGLPESARYDRRNDTNKLLLRSMLTEFLGYDAAAVGKRYFEFDGAGFIVRNRTLVRDEIAQCALWRPEAMTMIDTWLSDIESRPLLYHSLLTLFMVSGWFNHSRYLNGSG